MNFKDVLSAVALSDRATGSLPPASCETLYIYIDRHLCVCHGTYQAAQRLYRTTLHVDKTKKSLITEKYNHLYTDCRHCAGGDNVIRKAHEREVSGLFSLRWACSPLMLIPIIAGFVFFQPESGGISAMRRRGKNSPRFTGDTPMALDP